MTSRFPRSLRLGLGPISRRLLAGAGAGVRLSLINRTAFVANTPGKWTMRCHMIERMAASMATWFQVDDMVWIVSAQDRR